MTSVAAGSILLVPLGTFLHQGSMFVVAVLDHGSSRERRERKCASQRSRRLDIGPMYLPIITMTKVEDFDPSSTGRGRISNVYWVEIPSVGNITF